MGGIVYLNGCLIPSSQAALSPFDHGFLYGYGIFETMRAYQGHIFHLREHLARLSCSADILGLAIPLSAFALEKACQDTLHANNLREARVRLTVSAGEGDIIPDPSTCHCPTVFIVARSYVPPNTQTYTTGFTAIISSLRRNSSPPLSQLKLTSYLENILAKREAKMRGADEAILFNERGFLAEGSTSNIFVVNRGRLLTPSLESGALPGITRQVVLQLASLLNIKAEEGDINMENLLAAEEAFLTNSLLEIMPLTQVNGKPLGSGKPGSLTVKLRVTYRELVKKELKSGGDPDG